jgi:hypothetical protein
MSKICDPFFTTKDVGKGTGLGLSIVDQIITSHGGELLIESEVGKGTTATIVLPLVASAPAEETDDAEADAQRADQAAANDPDGEEVSSSPADSGEQDDVPDVVSV